jgi:hypothetical protein
MELKYYRAKNFGKGFITHEDMELAYIQSFPGDIWVTTNTVWASRVNAEELTKEQAQGIVTQAELESFNFYEPPVLVEE